MNLDRIRVLPMRGVATLMLLVAAAALLVAWARHDARRQVDLESMALVHRLMASGHAVDAQFAEIFREAEDDPRRREWRTRVARHHRELERVHAAAALKPWEHVPPDPLPPSWDPEDEQQASSER